MKKVIITLAALGLSSVAMAEGPSYTYVDLGYLGADSGDDQTTGVVLSGSLEVFSNFHTNFSYSAIDDAAQWDGVVGFGDTDSGSDDFDVWRLAVGMHPAITDSTDLVLEIGVSQGEYDRTRNNADTGSVEPDAVDLTFGVRSMIADNFELNAAAILAQGSTDFGGSDDYQEVGLRIGGQYFFTDAISVNVAATSGYSPNNGNIDGDSIQIGGRWSFGGGLFQ
jgi:hypothetical protein